MSTTHPRRGLARLLGALVAAMAAVLLATAPASAGTPTATFSMTPTEGPVGTSVHFQSVTPCANGEDEAVLSNVMNPLDGDIIATTSTVDGEWQMDYEIPGGTPVGPLTFYAYCSYADIVIGLGGAPSGDISMPYVSQVFMVTATTTTPTTVAPNMWLDLDKATYVQGQDMAMNTGGWMPGTDVNITIFSDPIDLGFAVADQLGELNHGWTVPLDFQTGIHTVTLTGLDVAGNLVSLSQQFDVTPLAGALSQLSSTTSTAAAAVATAATLPVTGVTQYTLPLSVAGLLLALGGAGLLAVERQRRGLRRARSGDTTAP